MRIPAKYQHLIGKGLDVQEGEKCLELTFSDFRKFQDFLLLYEKEDFSEGDLRVNSFGKCQGGCGQIFMGGLTDELISLASTQAREMQAKGGILIVHLCPLCQIKEAGGLQELIDGVAADKKRLLRVVN